MASNQNKQVREDDGSFSQYLNNNNDQSMVNQLLPYMLERVPSIASSMTGELIEIPSNAPPTLPSPPLFPGEVLRMRQHKVVCVDSFSEPLLGVVYLTNFRIIFNGLPIKSPELFEVLKEMQFTGSGNSTGNKESGEFNNKTTDGNNGSGTFRSFRRKKFTSNPRTTSNFYINSTNDGEGSVTGVEADSLHSKVIKKISSTLTRSSDNAPKSDQMKGVTEGKRSSKPVSISLPIAQDVMSASVPNPSPVKHPLQEDKSITLPRPVPSHQLPGDDPSFPQQYDSGFIDPPVLSKPGSIECQLDSNTATVTPGVIDNSLFLMSTEEVDFEKSIDIPEDEDVLLRNKRRIFALKRPDSILAVESDSDSDNASDKYFGSIAEDDGSTEDNLSSVTTSPDYVLSPTSNESSMNRFKQFTDPSKPLCPVNQPKPVIKPPCPRKPRTLTRQSLESNESHPLTEDYVEKTEESTPTQPITPDPLPKPAILPDPLPTPAKPRKPPRRKNKFQKKDSSDSSQSKEDSDESTQSVTVTTKDEEELPPVVTSKPSTTPLFTESTNTNTKDEEELPPVVTSKPSITHLRPQSRSSLRRAPPPPPKTTRAQSTIVIETTTSPREEQPLATSPVNDDDYRISQASMIPNCPSNASLMKRFTLSTFGGEGINDRYSSFGWSHTNNNALGNIEKRSICNTWSDSRVPSTKSIPYIHYSHSTSIPLRSLRTVKLLPSMTVSDVGLKLPDGVVLVSNGFSSLKLYLHSSNTFDSSKFKELLDNTLAYHQPIYSCFAFKYRSAIKMPNPNFFDLRKFDNFYSFDAEVERLRILETKIENSQIWRVTTVTKDHPELCRSYPERLMVLLCTPDVDLLRGASVYQEGRFPTACWMGKNTESVLLRGAATTSERGQHGSKLPVDEAILHAIRKCSKTGHLFVFTEKAEQGGFQDPTKLTADAARSYFYHNCHFTYAINPPTFKSIRHSFNKLQAMMLNNIPDEDYLIVLDSTRWLSRVGELLDTACKVSRTLSQDKGHVLVCYESGWDRTAQIVSLAQLLCDPYYRTMDGFQVLIQKEWVWFGHPFGLRNGHIKSKVKSEGPVFLQWLDCVYQVLRQFPLAFEFNESLLMALLDQSYSDQFGTFLVNSEKERQQRFMVPDHYHQSVTSNTVSIWSWILLMNASNTVFYNPLYNKEFHPGVIYPKCQVTCLELWRSCYERDKVRMELQENGYHLLKGDVNQLLSLYYDCKGPSNDPMQSAIGGSTSPTHSSSMSLRDELGPSPVPAPVYGKLSSRTKSDKTFSSIIEYLKEGDHDPSICHYINISGSICQGYLVKEGGVMKTWKKRWFVLDYQNAYFAYFETEEHFKRNENPKGVIPLNQIQKVVHSSKRDHTSLTLFHVKTPNRLYSIKAPSIQSMDIWVECLKVSPSALNID